jgi:hypothetical protein
MSPVSIDGAAGPLPAIQGGIFASRADRRQWTLVQ